MGRTASRVTVVSSLLLPMPVAVAAGPLAPSLSEDVLGVSRVPVTGVGDPAQTHQGSTASERRAEPAASLTRLQKARRADAAASEVAANGVPAAALRAYRTAEATMSVADPSCRLGWELLAGIGRIESDHGR
ncbi:MAG: hypothetical protein M3165_01850, partial [Actinomycetota bacterium]|nr:hypothetical protein [Actinomycetota bacterium]